MSRLLFIKTGYVIPGIPAELGDFEHWTAAAAGLPLERCHVVPVIDGERLPVARDYSGVVISGSAAMVTSRESWSEYTADWLRETVESGVPMLGICYGHQLLAQALGGRVDYHPGGREMGTTWIHTAPAAQQDELFAAMPSRFPAQVTHMQSVLGLPRGAEVLAWSSFEAHHAVRFASRVWGLQFHPEFTPLGMWHYLRLRSEALRREGQDPEALMAAVQSTDAASALLRRFVTLER